MSGFITDVFSHSWSYRPQVSLDGWWSFQRDPEGVGRELGWHEGRGVFPQRVTVPGAPQAQGIGEPTHRQRSFFMEPFWVRRAFTLPALEADQRLWLRLGGVLPAANVYLNGAHVGHTKSSRTQQRVDVTELVHPAAENLIAIEVGDFPEVRLDGIWEMGEAFKMWTGVYRPVTCEWTRSPSVLDVYARPRLAASAVQAEVELSEAAQEPLELILSVREGEQVLGAASARVEAGASTAALTVELVEPFVPWSPAHPQLYFLDVDLMRPDGTSVDRVGQRFGMRELEARGTKFTLNGNPIFLNGIGDDQLYPETLSPPVDKDWYVTRLQRARAYGMNASKSCVEILPPEYLEAADEVGLLVIQEMPFGLSELRANKYTVDERFMEYYAVELEGLVRQDRNHACLVAFSMTSEMEFGAQTQASFDFFNRQLPQRTRQLAPHALVIDCTGYLTGEDTDKGQRVTDFYATVHPKWMKEILDESDMPSDDRHPTILHEYNWWSCYPDPMDRAKYAGAQLIPFWLDTLEKTARENGQEALLGVYRANSLWLQTLGRKDGIEYARRNPGVEGYLMWLLIDLMQYSEGLFDDFWNPKNVSPEEFLQSNGETVVLLAVEGQRVFEAGTEVEIPLAVSHYGEGDIRDARLCWQARVAGELQAGECRVPELVAGELTPVGQAHLRLPQAATGYGLELEVALHHGDKAVNTNAWSFWALPEIEASLRPVLAAQVTQPLLADGTFLRCGVAGEAPIPSTASLVITDRADEALVDHVAGGGTCLLISRGAVIENTEIYYQTTSFYGIYRTIPWNAGTSGNSGTVIAEHPALARFPHEGLCDLPFLQVLKGALPMDFEPLREYGVEPIIRNIDHYAANRNNAFLLEFGVDAGRVLATSLDVLGKLADDLAARHLLSCLVEYARGPEFRPGARVPAETVLRLFSQREDGSRPGGPDEMLVQ